MLTALAVVAVVATVTGLGMLWYGVLFKHPWMHALGLNEQALQAAQGRMVAGILSGVAGSAAMALVIAGLMDWTGDVGVVPGILAGLAVFAAGCLFTVPKHAAFQGVPLQVAAIDAGYELASLVLAGAITGAILSS